MFHRVNTRNLSWIIIFILLIGLNSSPVSTADSSDQLELNKTITRDLKGGESHSYQIKLQAGEFLHVVVKQRYIDLQLVLSDADGKSLVEIDSPNENHGLEALSFIAERPGNYQLIARSLTDYVAAGQYLITITDQRAATTKEQRYLDAQTLMKTAADLYGQNSPEASQEALEKYQQALSILERLGLKAEMVNLLDILATISSQVGKQQAALEYAQGELLILKRLGDCREESQAALLIGDLLVSLKEMEKAKAQYLQVITGARLCRSREIAAQAVCAIAGLSFINGEIEPGLLYAHEALPQVRALEIPLLKVMLLTKLASWEDSYGDKQQAIALYRETLTLARSINSQTNVAVLLSFLSDIYLNMGDLQQALDYDKEMLEIYRKIKDRSGEASALSNTALAYTQLGEVPRALELYQQALTINRELGDRNAEAYTLNNIGFAYKTISEHAKSLEYFQQALPLLRETGDRYAEASELKNIGEAYVFLKKPQEALKNLNQALAIHHELGNRAEEALAQSVIGFAYDYLNRLPQSLKSYNAALTIFREVYDFDSQYKTLGGLARVYRKLGNYTKARASLEEAIQICEKLRAQVTNDALRASFFATLQDTYKVYIDLLMEMHQHSPKAGFNVTALQVSESARARSLLEMLAESNADIRQGIDAKLLARERDLQQQINSKAAAQLKLLTGEHTKEQLDTATQELDSLTASYQDFQRELRKNSPRYAALQYPAPLSSREIQQQVLDDDSVLLEYALGDNRSFVWVISKNSFRSYQLPKRSDIETAARRVYQLLTERNRLIKGESSEARKTRIESADKDYPHAAIALSKMVITPIAAQLGKKRLLVVSEGALQYVPFGALAVPLVGNISSKSFTPLITEHEVINLPSASTIGILRSELAGRKPASKTLAVMADPVFEKDDERITQIAIKADKQPVKSEAETRILVQEEALKSASESGAANEDLRIPRLPGTLQEAEKILALASDGQSRSAIGFSANRAMISSNELSQYRIIHFATHGFADSLHPELSGVMLSMFDKEGRPQDGFLRAHEIFNLNLPVELVVLSACQTGLGKDVRGEGLVGLTRGFMYAGAARIVVSLWNVSDKATSELMVKFYEKMLKQDNRPAAALRAAQLEMWQSEQWNAPFYWAAFQLQGEWN